MDPVTNPGLVLLPAVGLEATVRDVRASAGPGAINDGIEESSPSTAIRWSRSSRPAIAILLDTSQRVPLPPGIFVIWDGMGIVAKRIEHVPHPGPPKIVIKSINPEYQTYERDADEVNIVGRVIWAARQLWCWPAPRGGSLPT